MNTDIRGDFQICISVPLNFKHLKITGAGFSQDPFKRFTVVAAPQLRFEHA